MAHRLVLLNQAITKKTFKYTCTLVVDEPESGSFYPNLIRPSAQSGGDLGRTEPDVLINLGEMLRFQA